MMPVLWELDRVDWSALRAEGGNAAGVPAALKALCVASSEEEAAAAYWRIDNVVVVQGRVYQAAEYVVPVALQLLLAESPTVQRRALELLIQITGGTTDPQELAVSNLDVAARCRHAAKRGLELVYALVGSSNAQVRDRSVELLDYVEDDADRLVWTLRRLAEVEADSAVRDLAQKIVRDRSE